MDSFEELYLLMKYLHKRREANKIKEKERKTNEEEMSQLELKEMLREMKKWYLLVEKKITCPVKKKSKEENGGKEE